MSSVARSARKGSRTCLLDRQQDFLPLCAPSPYSTVAVPAAVLAPANPRGKVLLPRQSSRSRQQRLHCLARWFQRALAAQDACIRKIWTFWVHAEGASEEALTGVSKYCPLGGWDKYRMLHTVVCLHHSSRAVFRRLFRTWHLLTRTFECERLALVREACSLGGRLPASVESRIAAVEEELGRLWQERPTFSLSVSDITLHELRLAYETCDVQPSGGIHSTLRRLAPLLLHPTSTKATKRHHSLTVQVTHPHPAEMNPQASTSTHAGEACAEEFPLLELKAAVKGVSFGEWTVQLTPTPTPPSHPTADGGSDGTAMPAPHASKLPHHLRRPTPYHPLTPLQVDVDSSTVNFEKRLSCSVSSSSGGTPAATSSPKGARRRLTPLSPASPKMRQSPPVMPAIILTSSPTSVTPNALSQQLVPPTTLEPSATECLLR